MSFTTKSYKKGDGWGLKADRKIGADRSERHRIKKKLYENKTLFNQRVS